MKSAAAIFLLFFAHVSAQILSGSVPTGGEQRSREVVATLGADLLGAGFKAFPLAEGQIPKGSFRVGAYWNPDRSAQVVVAAMQESVSFRVVSNGEGKDISRAVMNQIEKLLLVRFPDLKMQVAKEEMSHGAKG